MKFSDNDFNKFILLLRNGVYEYMDNCEKFNETTFYSNLNMEDITNADYMHAKRVCKDFKIKNLGEYYDLYLTSDTLLLVDIFENFRNMCLKIHHWNPVKFLSAPRLAWQTALKKTEVQLELSTDNEVILMVEKWNRGGISHAIH